MKKEKALNIRRISIVIGVMFCSLIIVGCGQRKSEKSPETIQSNLNVTSVEEVKTEDVNKVPLQLEALEKAPPIKFRNDLINNMKNEDTKHTIINIPNLDDTVLAFSSFINSYNFLSASDQNKYVTYLMRVRKLYAIGQENSEQIISELRRLQKDSLKEWPEALKKRSENYDNGILIYSKPDAYWSCLNYCIAATYLLAEFGDYNSLPILSRQYNMHNFENPSPVPPATTFYAMHRLISIYPRDSLSKDAILALDMYLDAAKDIVPPPKQIKVTTWNAAYSESDPRLDILGVKNEILDNQNYMTMTLYPDTFKDGSKMQTVLFGKTEKMEELFNKLDAFVRIVYPAQGNSPK